MTQSRENSDCGKGSGAFARREAIKRMLGLPVAAGLGAMALPMAEERILLAEEAKRSAESGETVEADAVSGATRTSWELPKLAELNEPIPHAMLGSLEVSRLILGGNLIGGWAHSRDLIYVSELVKRYHTKEKVFQTFQLAEKCGINTFMGNPVMNKMMEEYWRWTDAKLQFISDCGGGGETIPDHVRAAIDFGCDAGYLHGGMTDDLVQKGDFATIEECLRLLRDAGLPAGLGAHYQATADGITAAGIEPDFWMKTYHPLNYWSAQSASEYDNIFCREPEATEAFMAKTQTPWIAFKVLAAGAFAPSYGFQAALDAGADFLCVGMYDFQMVDDVNIACNLLKNLPNRKRRMLESIPVEKIS